MRNTTNAGVRRAMFTSLVMVALASGIVSAQQRTADLLAPKACRANGLWVLERQPAEAPVEHWETLAMAPWGTWAAGFALVDGRGSSMAIRVSYTALDRIELTGAQENVEQEPAVFVRITPSGCTFHTTDEGLSYRFRRER